MSVCQQHSCCYLSCQVTHFLYCTNTEKTDVSPGFSVMLPDVSAFLLPLLLLFFISVLVQHRLPPVSSPLPSPDSQTWTGRDRAPL